MGAAGQLHRDDIQQRRTEQYTGESLSESLTGNAE